MQLEVDEPKIDEFPFLHLAQPSVVMLLIINFCGILLSLYATILDLKLDVRRDYFCVIRKFEFCGVQLTIWSIFYYFVMLMAIFVGFLSIIRILSLIRVTILCFLYWKLYNNRGELCLVCVTMLVLEFVQLYFIYNIQ